MDGYKQYIKTKVVGTDILVIDGYGDWQTEKFDPLDTQLSGTFPRQFPYQIYNYRGQYNYNLVNGSIVARTQSELDVEWNSRPPEPPSTEDRIAAAESAIVSIMGL